MKYLCHVPSEQYGFISVEVEGTAQDAVEAYNDLKQALTAGTGLLAKDFCTFIDCYLTTGKPPDDGLEQWEQMNDTQRLVVNEIKKCFSRLKKK